VSSFSWIVVSRRTTGSREDTRRHDRPADYRRGVDASESSPWVWVRVALVAFVLLWILGPSELRDTVPILVVFLLALGLEVNFLVGALRNVPSPAPDRGPQPIDRDRYGFDLDDLDDLEDGEEDDELYWAPAPAGRATALRRFGLGVAVIAVLVGVVWFVESRSGWNSVSGEARSEAVARFSDEASRIAGKPVAVRCDEARDYVGAVQHVDGVATVGGDLAIVTPEICNDLYRLAFDGDVTGSRTGRAIAVLAHEAWHLRGVADEATTECYALQSGVELGRRLGLDDDTARQLMRQQLTENALRGAESLEYRLTSDCREGGRLDLARGSSSFP
jgi:hypothetical protein